MGTIYRERSSTCGKLHLAASAGTWSQGANRQSSVRACSAAAAPHPFPRSATSSEAAALCRASRSAGCTAAARGRSPASNGVRGEFGPSG
eukprot:3804618-Pleurochrysis_carterae.AAC.3